MSITIASQPGQHPDRRQYFTSQGWPRLSLRNMCFVAVLLALASDPRAARPEGWKAPEAASKKKSPLAGSPQDLSAGRRLYLRDCASCHGITGKGDGPKAKDLKVSAGDLSSPQAMDPQTDGDLFWKITVGNHPMPGYEKTMTEKQRWQLVLYMRKLAASGTSATTPTATTARKSPNGS